MKNIYVIAEKSMIKLDEPHIDDAGEEHEVYKTTMDLTMHAFTSKTRAVEVRDYLNKIHAPTFVVIKIILDSPQVYTQPFDGLEEVS